MIQPSICHLCRRPADCRYVSLEDERLAICRRCSDEQARGLLRCPRCFKRKSCRAVSRHDGLTRICASCAATERDESAGAIPDWRGHRYWRSSGRKSA